MCYSDPSKHSVTVIPGLQEYNVTKLYFLLDIIHLSNFVKIGIICQK